MHFQFIIRDCYEECSDLTTSGSFRKLHTQFVFSIKHRGLKSTAIQTWNLKLRSHQKSCEYSQCFTRLTICGFSRHSHLSGGGAYLCGFTPWKPLSFPSSTTEELTTSSALYLLWKSHCNSSFWSYDVYCFCTSWRGILLCLSPEGFFPFSP